MKKIGYKILSPLFLFGLLVFSFEANPALNENFDNSDFALTANKRYETPYFTFSHFEDPITKPSDFIGNKVRSDVSSRDKSDPTYLFNNFVIPNTHGAEMETIGNKLETDQSGHTLKVFTTYSVSKMIDFPIGVIATDRLWPNESRTIETGTEYRNTWSYESVLTWGENEEVSVSTTAKYGFGSLLGEAEVEVETKVTKTIYQEYSLSLGRTFSMSSSVNRIYDLSNDTDMVIDYSSESRITCDLYLITEYDYVNRIGTNVYYMIIPNGLPHVTLTKYTYEDSNYVILNDDTNLEFFMVGPNTYSDLQKMVEEKD